MGTGSVRISSDYSLMMNAARRKKRTVIIVLSAAVLLLALTGLFTGSSHMSLQDAFSALLNRSTPANNRIIWSIRIPRVLAAMIAGAGLSVSGLIMQTVLGNPMASPSTLGITNASVFGANLSIIISSGGFMAINPFSASLSALIFAVISVFIVLGLSRIKSFSPGVVVLCGITLGAVWTAATTILQFYATDAGLSSAVIWSFGDLGRATYTTDLFMLAAVCGCSIVFMAFSWKLNACLSGDSAAAATGVNVPLLRFISLLLSSLITAVCVSFLGIIGFVGIICPHITKKLLGQDHRYTIPVSLLTGAALLTAADVFSRIIGNGSAVPVGAITSLLGAPFFLIIIISGRSGKCLK
ncbi:MAG: iron ABC transporter permease [Parasporobacterium sp.]|nr:iron ABC transporter permease [Parasporobacterium sp.]